MHKQPVRWHYAAAAVVMQLCLGVLYSWSVFRGPLAELYGWSQSQTIAPYRYSLLFFTVGMIVAGFWQDRKGPRLVGSAGGLLLGLGCMLAALIGDTVGGLVLSYGVVAGLGVGFAYVTPIATCIKWFPDKRGMIVGFAVMGFGAGSLIFAPLLEAIIGEDPARLSVTLPRAFWIMSVIFTIFVIGAAQFYKVPPPGWRPAGWSPPAAAQAVRKEEFSPREMLATWQFYVLWLLYFLGTSVGLTAIGEATPLVRQMALTGAAFSAGTALGLMSLFNGLGRLAWGTLSDRLGRKTTAGAMFAVEMIACLFFLRSASHFWEAVLGLCIAGFAYGGYLALMPSFTADYFGSRHLGANYGILFSAWGLCGFFVPGYFAGIMDAAKQANDVAGGYNTVYLTLAGFAAFGVLLAVIVRRPGVAVPDTVTSR
jgi:OFA family oxalate/formate antiporter-like MFS transporter